MQTRLFALLFIALIGLNSVYAQTICELLCGNEAWDCASAGGVDSSMANNLILPLVGAALEFPLLAQYFNGARGGRLDYTDETNAESFGLLGAHLVQFFADPNVFDCTNSGTELDPVGEGGNFNLYLPFLAGAHVGLGVRQFEQDAFLGATVAILSNSNNLGYLDETTLGEVLNGLGAFLTDADVNALFVIRSSIGDILADEAFHVTGSEEEPIFPQADSEENGVWEIEFWATVVVEALPCLLDGNASSWFDGSGEFSGGAIIDFTDSENEAALIDLVYKLATLTAAVTETSLLNLPPYEGDADMLAVHAGMDITDEAYDAFLECLAGGIGAVYEATGGDFNNVATEGTALIAFLESLRVQIVDNGSAYVAPEPETPTPEPETPSPEPETPGPEPESPGPEPETPGPEPETPGPEPEGPEPETPPSSGSVFIASLTIVIAMISIFMF